MKKSQSRREFLRVSAAGALGAIVITQSGFRNGAKPAAKAAPVVVDPKTLGIGLQLYTIRDAMATDVPLP